MGRKFNFIFGVAGFAREIDWLINDIYEKTKIDYRPDFFVSEDGNEIAGKMLNGKPTLCESDFFENYSDNPKNCFLAVGNPVIKESIYNKIKIHSNNYFFPNIIHPSANFDNRSGKIELGEGNIICAKNVLTTDIKIENFVHINLDCTIGHDVKIGNYVTISPGVHISGNVILGDRVFIGTGSVIIEKVSVLADVVVGAGATVVRNILESGVYIGTPAKKIR